jgi:hypothetical protein
LSVQVDSTAAYDGLIAFIKPGLGRLLAVKTDLAAYPTLEKLLNDPFQGDVERNRFAFGQADHVTVDAGRHANFLF